MVSIPTTKELYESILHDLQVELGVTNQVWNKRFLIPLALVQAAKLKLSYLALGNVQKNIFPDLADSVQNGGTLERFGRVKIGRGPQAATQGKYLLFVSGVVGSYIKAGTTFKQTSTAVSSDVLYILDSEVVLLASIQEIEARCLTPGVEGRLNIGAELNLTAPIIGVDNKARVSLEVVIPNNSEDIEEYRRVVLESFRLMPQGGASSDYRIWAQDAIGVKQSYPYAVSGRVGEVNLFVEATIENSVDGHGTPTTTIIDDVKLKIEADPVTAQGRRPLATIVNVLPVIVYKIDIELPSFQDLTAQKEAVILEVLRDLVDNIRPFVAGADVVANRNDVLSNNVIINSILNAIPGSGFATPVLRVTKPGFAVQITPSQVFDNGAIPFLNSITYV